MNYLFGKIVFSRCYLLLVFFLIFFANTWFAKRFCVVFYSPECALQIWFIVFFSFSFDDLVSLDKLFANPVFNYFLYLVKLLFRVIFFCLLICLFSNDLFCEYNGLWNVFVLCFLFAPNARCNFGFLFHRFFFVWGFGFWMPCRRKTILMFLWILFWILSSNIIYCVCLRNLVYQ